MGEGAVAPLGYCNMGGSEIQIFGWNNCPDKGNYEKFAWDGGD